MTVAVVLFLAAAAVFVLATFSPVIFRQIAVVPLGLFFLALAFLSFLIVVPPQPEPEPPVDSSTWHVSPAGNDAVDCTQAQSPATPKRTLAAGLACIGEAGTDAGAGKTLKVAAGVYSESLIDLIPSGSGADAPFTIECETDFQCIDSLAALDARASTIAKPSPVAPPLYGRSAAPAAQIGINRPSHWISIYGIKFEGGGGTYMSGRSPTDHQYISFVNCEFSNMPWGMGIQASAASNISVIGSRFYNIGTDCQPEGLCHAIYATDLTANWTISGNDIHDNAAYGIHLYGATQDLPKGFTIEGNKTYRNGKLNVNGTGMILYGDGHTVRNNQSFRNVYEGILLRGVSNNHLSENTTYDNGGAGINRESGVSTVCENNLSVSDAFEINCDTETGNIEIPGATQRVRPPRPRVR